LRAADGIGKNKKGRKVMATKMNGISKFIGSSSEGAQKSTARTMRINRQTLRTHLGILLSMAALSTVQVRGANLIVNGDFESGGLAGWTEVDQAGGSGSWFNSTPGANSPLSGFPTAPNALGGTNYAVSDQGGPGCHVLLQSFTLASATTLTLSYQMFVNSQDGSFNPGNLDYTTTPSEYGRVDLLTGTATPFSTAGADVLQTFYAGNDPTINNPNPYTTYSYNLSLTAGTYQLRFGEVDNQLFFQMGVDNVSLVAVPEPTTLALVGLSGLSLLLFRRQRK
jgi:PEP-CTERM motif